ncbi:MAG: LysM peptidoglycan-binding domain-containing protein [Candidatus Saccharibacteria bacterium]
MSDTSNKQQTQTKTRRGAKSKIKPSLIAVYASTFVFIIALIFIGYQGPQNSSAVSNAANVNSASQVNETSVDDVVSTSVAANVAQAANLPIATSVTNLAISAQTKSEFSQADVVSTTKPQLIQSSAVNRSVTTYVTVAGDTVDTLSAKYGISKETIKWANNLTTDAIPVGKELKILPVDGVIYNVKAGDTIDSISTKYSVDKTRLVLYNDLDISGLAPNTSIILPNATLPGEERPGYVAPVVYTPTVTFNYAGAGTGFGGDTWRIGVGTADGPYAHGNCTLYSYNRRIQLGLPVGTNWGNAGSWAANARANGLVVNSTPGVGAVIQDWGHVAIVESILPNGDLSISEMNAYVSGGGYNIVSGRIVPAGNIGQYLYIH